MSLAQGNNTPTWPRIEPWSPDPESDAPQKFTIWKFYLNKCIAFMWLSFNAKLLMGKIIPVYNALGPGMSNLWTINYGFNLPQFPFDVLIFPIQRVPPKFPKYWKGTLVFISWLSQSWRLDKLAWKTCTVKFLNFRMLENFAVIYLKL